ncbi:nucleoporin ndc1-like [Plakobranchus ocellatus]|uniref:Nucleoporin ndc1-like n=1 Tax=Plakobranchus ocellatus TaxID=259542 RepID=A0AAV3YN58_9GAST|nr:nucleoporin ndc1-like [Plakobranchus ocellatus]
MVTWVSLPHFSVSSDLESSQLAFATSLFKWSRLPLMVICLLAASVSSWSLSRLCGEQFQSLTRLDETDTYARVVMNEYHLFLVLSGIGTGLAYYITFFQKRKYYLHFPHVHRYRLAQIRSELPSLINFSLWQALNVLKYLYGMYFLFAYLKPLQYYWEEWRLIWWHNWLPFSPKFEFPCT